jgi:hypothetical protein
VTKLVIRPRKYVSFTQRTSLAREKKGTGEERKEIERRNGEKEEKTA